MNKNKENNEKIRAGIYGMAALYMLYTAVQLYKEGGNTVPVILFVLAAIGLLAFSLVIAVRVTKKEKAHKEEIKIEE